MRNLSPSHRRFIGLIQRILGVLLIAVCMLLLQTQASAQSGAGAIQGTVQDATGAAIPNATVHVENKATGQSVDTTSNGAGFYSVPSLFAGDYTLTFTVSGMKQQQESLTLRVGQTATVNPSLSAGEVTQQIVVQGDQVQLATYDSPTVSSTLENSRINQLPMNGRNILTLTGLTTPGVESGGTRVNGNLAFGIEYVQDGAPLTNQNFGGPTRLPDPDSVQEVRMETTNSSAQFATPATGILTTKSGTNSLHGTAFETMRNNYIGIAKSRSDPATLRAPHYVRNEFGASLGGPIILPKLYNGRDRSFFFGAYERYSLRSFNSLLVTVPTQAMRNGDFSGLVNSNGTLQQLYDNQTTTSTGQRTAFVNNQIPMSRISPLAKALYTITPLPSTTDNPLVAGNLSTPGINNTTAPTFTGRLDHSFSDNTRAYLRYTYTYIINATLRNNPTNGPSSLAAPGFAAGATNAAGTSSLIHSAAFALTHVFSPSFLSETVISGEWEGDKVNGGPAPAVNYEAQLGLPNNFGLTGFPNIGTNLFMNYDGTQFAYGGSQLISTIDENFTKTIGRHQMLFGGRYRHEGLGVSPDQRLDQVSFTNNGTGLLDPGSGTNYSAKANTGNANADFFLGAGSKYTVNLEEQYLHYRQLEFDTYFQENFHVNSKLVVNVGVRWEIHPAPVERNRQNNGFDIANKAIVLGQPIEKMIARGATTQAVITNLTNLGVKFETPQAAGLPDSMVFDSNFTFSPRLGISYQPFGSRLGTVLRGGFGRYIYTTPLRNYYASQSTNAPYQFAYSMDYNAANQSPDGLPNYLLRTPQTIIAGQNSANIVNSATINSILPGINETILNPHYPPNFVTQGNVTIEQPIKWNSVVRFTYIYDHGTNLDQLYYINNHPSNWVYEKTNGVTPPTGTYASVATGPYDQTTYGAITQQNRNGFSNDNAFQVNLQHLYKSGYAFQAYYVFSKAFRQGGNTFRDGTISPIGNYWPGLSPIPQGNLPAYGFTKALNRFENYQVDTATPKHHISFNGIFDLPMGRNKHFFSHVNRFVDELIGGYQIAGDGNIVSQFYQPSTSNWGPTTPIQTYKHSHKVTDCRSGVCRTAYQWFNGFVAPEKVNVANGVQGLPSDYVANQVPLNMIKGDPNYETNNDYITLNNQSRVSVAYSPGPGIHPYSHTFLLGPFNYTVDLSVFKVFPITEKVNLRLNMDAFNALNVQGYVNPNTTDGIEQITSSYNTPRQVQFTARLTF